MNLARAKSQSGMGGAIVLTSPYANNHCLYFCLEFEGTNNGSGYEALLHGFDLAKDYGIKFLKIIGDFDPIVMQVKGKCACKKQRLKRYMDVVRLVTKNFKTLSL